MASETVDPIDWPLSPQCKWVPQISVPLPEIEPGTSSTRDNLVSSIYRGRLSVVDVPRLQTEPGLSFCSEPFGLEQRNLGIASVPQGTKQFIALNGERACSARQAEAKQQQPHSLCGHSRNVLGLQNILTKKMWEIQKQLIPCTNGVLFAKLWLTWLMERRISISFWTVLRSFIWIVVPLWLSAFFFIIFTAQLSNESTV